MDNERYKENSKKRLLNILKKKFDTTIIGSLAAFEENFGHIWGHNLPEDELTEDQLMYRDIWEATRTQILDNGNLNSRSSQSEVSQYTLSWNRYVTNFTIKDN